MQLRNWNMVIAAAIAGIAGTIIFDILGALFGAGWDVPGALSMVLGAPFALGVVMHYGNGIVLAVIFAGLIPLFFGPLWLRGAIFGTVQTILGVWFFMMPMMEMGIAGVDSPMGFMMGFMSLVRHWAYGIVVGLVYGALAPRFAGSSAPTTARRPATERV